MLKYILILMLIMTYFGMTNALRTKRGIKENYWRVLCLLKRVEAGMNTWAIAHTLDIDPEVAYQTLERLYYEGYSDFKAVSGDHVYEWLNHITDDGHAIIEQYKWQLHASRLYTE